jgi:hypothetical protein
VCSHCELEINVLGHFACFADVSASAPVAPQGPMPTPRRRPPARPSINVTHVACDALFGTTRRDIPFWLSIQFTVAYLSCIYYPSPGLGQRHRNTIALSPRFAFACPPPLAPSVTPVTNSQPCCWSHAGPTRTASLRFASHSLTHTHTLSPSLSGSGDNNPRTPPHVQPCARSHFGDVARFILFHSFPNSRADLHSAIQHAGSKV